MTEGMMTRVAATLYEPQLRKLPEYGKLLFDHLSAEYATVIAQRPTPEERAELQRIKTTREQDALAWKDIYLFEQILVRYLDLSDLKRKIKTLRGQFRNIAGAKDFDVYLAAKPPDVETETDEARLRQDCHFLLNEFFLRYALTSAREHMRSNLLKIAALMAVVTIVVGGFFTYINFSTALSDTLGWGYGVTTLAVVMFAGIVGALISVQQRIQSAPNEGDPIYLFSMLTHGRFGIFLSPISGAVFSVALYLMFTGGLLSGKIFPTITTVGGIANAATATATPTPSPKPSTPASATPSLAPATSPSATHSSVASPTMTATTVPSVAASPVASPVVVASPDPVASAPVLLNKFLKDTGPATGVDYALLVIWAFIAGFAERFVPDALNRLVANNAANPK
jgi:hypothetical protein